MKKYLWMSSAAVVIGALRVNIKAALKWNKNIIWVVSHADMEDYCWQIMYYLL